MKRDASDAPTPRSGFPSASAGPKLFWAVKAAAKQVARKQAGRRFMAYCSGALLTCSCAVLKLTEQLSSALSIAELPKPLRSLAKLPGGRLRALSLSRHVRCYRRLEWKRRALGDSGYTSEGCLDKPSLGSLNL